MEVSYSRGTPFKSSILDYGIFHYKLSILGTPIYGNPHIYIYTQLLTIVGSVMFYILEHFFTLQKPVETCRKSNLRSS
jgi:hypothetical protein